MRFVAASLTVVGLSCALPLCASASPAERATLFAVGYGSKHALAQAAAAGHGHIVRRLPRLGVAEVRARIAFASEARRVVGIRYVQRERSRTSVAEPALFATTGFGIPYEWQYGAAHVDAVPASVLRAASSITIAVIDTGADVTAPDLGAKTPWTFNLHTGSPDVRDVNGHGTFVSSLAAGSVTNGDGIAGFGGDARLLVIKASRDDGTLSDVDEATAIAYAVDHGARVINLSVGGTSTSFTERRGIQYAADHGVLIVAAAGNEFDDGNPVEYPSALLQPVGSNGRGGVGLSVGASAIDGSRAPFSNTGSQVSLLAPGEEVFGAVSSLSSEGEYPRSPLPGSSAGDYGFASGTSFSSPEVAGAAALVMAANPLLRASDVATILKETASGHGAWTPETGFGQIDVGAAVARAEGNGGVLINGVRTPGRVRLRWYSADATRYRITMRVDGGRTTVLLDNTTSTAATIAVHHGHRYVFTVSALDGAGASSTYSVRA